MRNSIALLLLAFLPVLTASCSHPKETREVESVEKMRELVEKLSAYAKKQRPGFLIIPQNGSEIAFTPDGSFDDTYLRAIDAIGIEGLFYNEQFEPDSARISNLRLLHKRKPVLVSDYVGKNNQIQDAFKKITDERFTPFVRVPDNFNYDTIPSRVRYSNTDDIDSIRSAKNYLYLINPGKYESRRRFLSDLAKTDFDVLILDLYFDSQKPFTATEIAELKKKANGGKRLVLCYVNIGAAENWRHYWQNGWKLHNPSFLARRYDGFDGEYWVEFWDVRWHEILYGNPKSYMSKILNAGFDGAYLDNIEAYRSLYR